MTKEENPQDTQSNINIKSKEKQLKYKKEKLKINPLLNKFKNKTKKKI